MHRPGWALTIIICPLKATREIMAINLSPQAALCHRIQQCILLLCTYSNLHTQGDMVDIVYTETGMRYAN